ncbi:unnamed protein product [Prorocentrum cordatum]|uniref:Ion transport domain-containing protein n=1 Tax=Prorocentrum cordatum TaxID=2364126 RepID=A0ABN9V9A8_9DINO|nr:unnamed protein product [Polarella glacialis]
MYVSSSSLSFVGLEQWLAFVCAMRWVQLVYALRAFECFGHLLLPITQSLAPTLGIFCITVFVFVGFMHAFMAFDVRLDAHGARLTTVIATFRFLFLGDGQGSGRGRSLGLEMGSNSFWDQERLAICIHYMFHPSCPRRRPADGQSSAPLPWWWRAATCAAILVLAATLVERGWDEAAQMEPEAGLQALAAGGAESEVAAEAALAAPMPAAAVAVALCVGLAGLCWLRRAGAAGGGDKGPDALGTEELRRRRLEALAARPAASAEGGAGGAAGAASGGGGPERGGGGGDSPVGRPAAAFAVQVRGFVDGCSRTQSVGGLAAAMSVGQLQDAVAEAFGPAAAGRRPRLFLGAQELEEQQASAEAMLGSAERYRKGIAEL